jgi:hypothetical protein
MQNSTDSQNQTLEVLSDFQSQFLQALRDAFQLGVNQAKDSIAHNSPEVKAVTMRALQLYWKLCVVGKSMEYQGLDLSDSEDDTPSLLYRALEDVSKYLTDQEKAIWNES